MTSPAAAPQATPERIMQMTFGFAPPLILEAAIHHGVFNVLDDGPKTSEQVGALTGASVRGLRSLMNALVGLRFLAKDAEGRYALTSESSSYLVSRKPGFLGGMLRHTSTLMLPSWLRLNEAIRTGRPALRVDLESEGAHFYQQCVEDLFPVNYPAARALADELGVAEARRPINVLDLGAGAGVWGIALAEKSPQVHVTAVDWSDVLPATARMAERFGLAERFRFVAGDLLETTFGSNFQVAILGHVLHSQGAERSRALLKKTYASLAPAGKVVVAEWLVNEDRTGPPAGLIFGLNMLVGTDQGDTFSFADIREWLEEAGFENARTVESPSPSPLILAAKPVGDIG
jgi:ubiquinone/menaquinone biosynthesis C-methylase UbiE